MEVIYVEDAELEIGKIYTNQEIWIKGQGTIIVNAMVMKEATYEEYVKNIMENYTFTPSLNRPNRKYYWISTD